MAKQRTCWSDAGSAGAFGPTSPRSTRQWTSKSMVIRKVLYHTVLSQCIHHDLMQFYCTVGWWNGTLSVEFLRYHFAARTSPQEPVLLLWDDFSGHWTADVQAYAASIGVVPLKVPPHATSVSQPADVAWNFPLKSRLRQQWPDDMRAQIAAPRPSGTRFKLARPKRGKIVSGSTARGATCRPRQSPTASAPAVYSRPRTATLLLISSSSLRTCRF